MNYTVSMVVPARSAIVGRVSDYFDFIKPRISALVLFAVFSAHVVATWGHPEVSRLALVLFGVAFVAASASAANQILEIDQDRVMARTADRPLPSGRIGTGEAVFFIGLCLFAGLIELWVMVGGVVALLGLTTWVVYVAIYTPLKVRSEFNTGVGAVAGALPVLIGWASADVPIDLRAVALFSIVYLWQFPHFMSIAWIYRDDYRRGGMRMLTVVDGSGRRAGVHAVAGAAALIPISVLPGVFAPERGAYALGAAVLGCLYLVSALAFFKQRDEQSARWLLRVSLFYLPAMLLWVMVIPYM